MNAATLDPVIIETAAHTFEALDVKQLSQAQVRAKLDGLAPHLFTAMVILGFTKEQLVESVKANPETWEGYEAELSEWRLDAESVGEIVNAALDRMLVAMATVAEQQSKN